MGTNFGRSITAFITQILFTLFIILQLSNLVICDDPDDDSLQNALEYVERRERDLQLQDNDYYGQPEDIGYGYQKNFGIFENGPARELGSPDSDPESEDFRKLLYNYANQREGFGGGYNKRRSSFRERYANAGSLVSQKESEDNQRTGSDIQCSYTRTLKDLWCKYLQSRSEDVGLEDVSPDQVAEILDTLYDRDDGDSYENSVYNDGPGYGAIPLRSRRNYRVFDRLNEKRRYPSFGEGFYGKRAPHSQHIGYENPPESDFLYALKFVNPDLNREAVENMKDAGYDVLGDEKDRDVIRMLNDAVSSPRAGQEEEAYWLKKEEPYDELWLPGPVVPSDDAYQDVYSSDKRTAPKIFKQHNGIHLNNNKRMPVKRSPVRSKKEAVADEKVSKEVKGIFEGQQTTTVPPKKVTTKKPTETVIKKQNVTKPEVTKHRDVKKLVRRANDYTKEQVYQSSEIDKIFNAPKIDKKSIDWSQYFGFDKRSEQWLRDDTVRRAESLFMAPAKRFNARERANGNFLDKSQYEAPFDTRIFNSKKKFYNVDKNIDRMERKLGNIEEKIIDDAVKYTGAHTGTPNEDMRKVKSEIVHHLEAAYSLEKMKNALEEFKNSMKSEKNFPETEEPKTETQKAAIQTTTVRSEKAKPENSNAEKSKRVSTKKEIDNVYGKDSLDFLNWSSPKGSGLPNNQYDDAEGCPVLDKSLSNCLKVLEGSGRFSELLLPICSLQQICYACGSEIGFSRPSACDLMYLTEAENLCQGSKQCLLSARDSMLALRDLHEQEILAGAGHQSGSCFLNPCIQKYFMNTPAAVVPLEFQD
ncbi:UNVERIFIED_CONTAM: hypothetical protein PYX00_010457 [Menopon gallinae]